MIAAPLVVVTEPCKKFLEVTIDETVSWTQHIDNLSKKLNTSLYVIKQIFHISDLKTANVTYYWLFEYQLRYGMAVWGGPQLPTDKKILWI